MGEISDEEAEYVEASKERALDHVAKVRYDLPPSREAQGEVQLFVQYVDAVNCVDETDHQEINGGLPIGVKQLRQHYHSHIKPLLPDGSQERL